MKFAQPWWLAGSVLALVVAAFLIIGAVLAVRALKRFGEEERVDELLTARAGGRRAFKGVLLVLAVAFAFVALAQPQYGRGTRLIPATNLDVVIVLDYSKSMYARDIAPSRISRAKTEVGRLISELPGARFAAVAFAGDPMSFPLTSDGAAISQFLRQLSPNDMPVGGTAIARALESARELMARDPLSRKHRRVIVLVTDGEDLEGDPVSVAEAAARDGISVHVVQVGGRTPEPIPDVDDSGEVIGMRTDDDGNPLTTQLTADGEAQLTRVAQVSSGTIVRAERGATGIRQVAARLRKLMTEELSEKVETVYADVYAYPLSLALLLLLIETFVGDARRRRPKVPEPPPPPRRRRKRLREHKAALLGTLLAVSFVAGCEAMDSLFMRYSPQVDDAIVAIDAGDAAAATELLAQYLRSGQCRDGDLRLPKKSVEQSPNAALDLSLGLFDIAETFGQRFGDEEQGGDGGISNEEELKLAERVKQVNCALLVVQLIGGDAKLPLELRARAFYLAGNLEFLRRDYAAAVKAYDKALKLIPGLPDDAGDGIGRDAAWNRAIALRRLEDQQDAGQDASQDAPDAPDAQPDAGSDGGDSGSGDGGDGGQNQNQDNQDSGNNQNNNQGPDSGQPDSGGGGDGGKPNDDQDQNQPQPPPENREPSVDQDERMLDMLERAPTLQQEAAKNRALGGARGMEDK